MADLIRPEDLPRWIPGELTGDSESLGWNGLRIRGYRYAASDVEAPSLRDYTVVVYEEGTTRMHRRSDGGWQTERVGPGSVSLLTHAVQSHWRWSEPIEVSHLYLAPDSLSDLAAEVFEKEIEDVELLDVLNVQDPVLCHLVGALEEERRLGGLGGTLYVDALRTQACIRILRRYATVRFLAAGPLGGLSRAQKGRVEAFIADNIERNITVAEIADVAQLGVFHFSKRFRAEFGYAPHAYVMQRRIEHAKRSLSHTCLPLAAVAKDAGFFDQSHMNRIFRRVLDTTPAAYRRATMG